VSAFASVIVPAHNEATTIEACLRSILDDERAGELDVIVVCNGCTDDTAERARRLGPPVRVLESDQASKAAALELGRTAAAPGPRLYIDADVVVSPGAISAVTDVLARPEVLAAAPRVRMDRPDATLPMRLFLDAWTRAPYFSANLIGAGFYGISEDGQRRMGPFPPIVADDMFALSRFRTDERAVADDATFSPLVSRRLRDLVRVEVRREAARREFADWAARTGAEVHHDIDRSWLSELARQPRRWPGLVTFVATKATIGALAAWRRRSDDPQAWSRDEHARAGASPS